MQSCKITLRDLFDFLEVGQEVDYFYTSPKDVFIKTPDGNLAPINGFIKKTDKIVNVRTTDASVLCGSRHKFMCGGHEVFAKDAVLIDTVSGQDEVVDVLDVEDDGFVYDISLPSPHLYTTPNGIVHHNTTIAKALCKELGCDYIVINCSENGNIDTLRTTIREFASTVSLDGGIKVVIMDEADGLTSTCFAGQQEVTIVQDGQEVNVPIETLVDMGECSFVTYDLATGKEKETRGYAYISGEKEVYKYTFDDGSVVYSTDDHKFFDEQGNEVTLDIGVEVISR